MLLEDENLVLVSAARDVRGARSVATFTSLTRRPTFGIERGLPMSGFLPTVEDLRMARLASFRTYIIGRARLGLAGSSLLLCRRCRFVAAGGRCLSLCQSDSREQAGCNKQSQESRDSYVRCPAAIPHQRGPPFVSTTLSAPSFAAFPNVSYAFMMSFIAKR